MEIEDANSSKSKEEALLGILSELDNIGCSEKTGKAIAITRDLIKTQSKLQNRNEDLAKEKELLLNAKEEWEKEKKRLIDENSTLSVNSHVNWTTNSHQKGTT